MDARNDVSEVLPQVMHLQGLGLLKLLHDGPILHILHYDIQFVHLGIIKHFI